MAITIEQEPSLFSPANNPLDFVFSSTQSAQDNFSIIVELFVAGGLHSTHQIFIEQDGLARFNASEILNSIVYSDLLPTGSIIVDYETSYINYYVKGYDKYGTPPTNQGGSATSTTLYAFNSALRHKDFLNFNYVDYDLTVVNGHKFLTSFPRTESYFCGINESMFLGMLNSNNGAVDVYANLFDVNGSLIVSDTTQLATSGRILIADVSPVSIYTNFTLISSTDFDDCYYYTVYFRETTYTSESFTIYLDNECAPFNSKRVHWLNKFGLWDSYTFNMYNDSSTNITRTEYQAEKGRYSSGAWGYSLQYGEIKNGRITTSDTITLNSDWIKEDKYQWLVQSLYESPKVYIEESYGNYELVIPEVSNFRRKTRFKDKLIQEELRLKRTYQYRSQLN